MALKVGDVCYTIYMTGTKIEFWEYHLRTIRTRHGWRGGYWWRKVNGDTWGKRSKAHGDFGWLPNGWVGWRVKHNTDDGRPYATTKLGALKDEIASTHANIDHYGENYDFDEEGATLGEQLKALKRAQKRLRAKLNS